MIPSLFAGLNIFAQTTLGLGMPFIEYTNEIYKEFYGANQSIRIFKCNTTKCKDLMKQAWQKGFSIKYPILEQ